MNNFSLTRQDTSVIKGIAILAMLCHHLYGCPPEGVMSYSGVLEWLGLFGKVCIALFLFCSGYGLSSNYQPQSIVDDIKFTAKRFVKFYANYWVISLIFVPITIFVFHRSLTDAYGADANVIKCLCLDVLGVQGYNSYNVTWWFNKLIIMLYVLYPLLNRIVRIKPEIVLPCSMVIMGISEYIPIHTADIWIWQFPFVFGIAWKLCESRLVKIQQWLTNHKRVFELMSIVVLIITIIFRMNEIIPHWSGVKMDSFITCSIVLCLISIIRNWHHVMLILAFIGKHSMNIYFTHTFINSYWFPQLLYTGEWLRGGGNFVVLIAICLLISIGIEFLKEKIRLYELVNIISKRI